MRMSAIGNLLRMLAIFTIILTIPSVHGQVIYLDDFADGAVGRFVMDAEHYSNRVSGIGSDWFEVDGLSHRFIEGPAAGTVAYTARSGARGNYMEAFGLTSGTVPPIDSGYSGPFLDYRVLIETPGAYRLYLRWTAASLSTDSIYAFILRSDGTLLSDAGPEWFLFHGWRSDWTWDNRGVKDTTASSGAGYPHTAVWTILEPGEYTVRIAMRETYSALDALIFQTEGLDAPVGQGPPESQSVSGTVGLAVARIRAAIGSKTMARAVIAETLESEALVVESLDQLLDSGDYVGRSYGEIVKAQQMVRVAMRQQEISMNALDRGIAGLEAALSDLEASRARPIRWDQWPSRDTPKGPELVVPTRR